MFRTLLAVALLAVSTNALAWNDFLRAGARQHVTINGHTQHFGGPNYHARTLPGGQHVGPAQNTVLILPYVDKHKTLPIRGKNYAATQTVNITPNVAHGNFYADAAFAHDHIMPHLMGANIVGTHNGYAFGDNCNVQTAASLPSQCRFGDICVAGGPPSDFAFAPPPTPVEPMKLDDAVPAPLTKENG